MGLLQLIFLLGILHGIQSAPKLKGGASTGTCNGIADYNKLNELSKEAVTNKDHLKQINCLEEIGKLGFLLNINQRSLLKQAYRKRSIEMGQNNKEDLRRVAFEAINFVKKTLLPNVLKKAEGKDEFDAIATYAELIRQQYDFIEMHHPLKTEEARDKQLWSRGSEFSAAANTVLRFYSSMLSAFHGSEIQDARLCLS